MRCRERPAEVPRPDSFSVSFRSGFGALDRGSQARNNPAKHRHAQSEGERAVIQADLVPAGNVAGDIGGHVMLDQIHAPFRHCQSHGGSGQ